MSKTRRMWARRAFRAGWLLAPIFAVPRWAVNKILWVFETGERTIAAFVIFFIASGITWIFFEGRRVQAIATPTQISEFINAGHKTCMADVMPRRQAAFKRPLTVSDFEKGIEDCQKARDNWIITEGQKAAMKVKK